MQDVDTYELSLDLPSECPSWNKQVCRPKKSMRSEESSLDKVRHVQSARRYGASSAMPRRKKALAASKPPTSIIITTVETSTHSRTESVDSKSTAGKSFDSLPINLSRQAKKLNDSMGSLTDATFTNDLKALPITELPELPLDPVTGAASSEASCNENSRCSSRKSDALQESPKCVMEQGLQTVSQSSESDALLKSPISIKASPSYDKSESPQKSPQSVLKQSLRVSLSPSKSQKSPQAVLKQSLQQVSPSKSPRSPAFVLKQSPHVSSSSPSNNPRSPLPCIKQKITAPPIQEITCVILPEETASQASGSLQKKLTIQTSSCSVSGTGSSSLKHHSIDDNDNNDNELEDDVLDALERFTTSHERSLSDQLASLTKRERNCYAILRQQWDADHPPMCGHMYLRVARFCRFDIRQGRKYLTNKLDQRYLNLTATFLKPQLLTQTLFPLPGLKSLNGLDMFYMRPALYFPQLTKTQTIIDNLAYVMLSMVEKEQASKNGIGFLAYMNDWTMDNFSVDYCLQFMLMLQGGVPARVLLFLIVNPPSWFGAIWKIMKTMLHPSFRRKVKMIPESKLPKFLAPGYQAYMPCDTAVGTCNTTQLVKDFITYRKHVEDKMGKRQPDL